MNNTPLFFILRKENLQEKTEEIISIYLSKTAKKGCEVELKKKIEISPT